MAMFNHWLSSSLLQIKKTKISSQSDSEYTHNPFKKNLDHATTDIQSIPIRSNNIETNKFAYFKESVRSALNEKSNAEDLSGAFTSSKQLLVSAWRFMGLTLCCLPSSEHP